MWYKEKEYFNVNKWVGVFNRDYSDKGIKVNAHDLHQLFGYYKIPKLISKSGKITYYPVKLVNQVRTMKEDFMVRFVDNSPLNLGTNPFNWMQGKWILKEIVAKHFGYDFAYRKKMIMNLDEREMVTDSRFVEYVHDQVFPQMAERGLFDVNKVQQMFDNAKTISSKQFTSMWKAISTETWCQLFIDKK